MKRVRLKALRRFHGLSAAAVIATSAAWGQEDPSPIRFKEGLVLPPVGKFQRAATYTDEMEYLRVQGLLVSPKEGDVVTLPDGATRAWKRLDAAEDGSFKDEALNGGYAMLAFDSPSSRVLLLDATGHSAAIVNDEPRAGDPYGYSRLLLPILARQGSNKLLLPCSRGRVKAELTSPPKPLFLDTRDLTLPNLIVGEASSSWGAITVVNATRASASLLRVGASVAGVPEKISREYRLVPLSARKCAFPIEAPPREAAGDVEVRVRLYAGDPAGRRVLDEAILTLKAVAPSSTHTRTFLSGVDQSAQYFAVVPAKTGTEKDPSETPDAALATNAKAMAGPSESPGPALFLSLHGAGVEASGQAACYAPKERGVVVAATNRRSFGFDWEDWGRLDALEVLDEAARLFHPDPLRVYLTGHSMGGHGTWQIGVTYPDRFAAIGPSAGWETFWSYAGAARLSSEHPVERLLARATNPSDTLALARNTLRYGVYVLHGDADDNVPVERARAMRTKLAEFHSDFAYYERPGAGHWWGNACLDWPAMFDFFQRHQRPAEEDVRHVEFITANPGISARCDWLTLEAQARPLEFSLADIRLNAQISGYEGTTENVERLAINLVALRKAWTERNRGEDAAATAPATPPSTLTIALDGQTLADIPIPDDGPLHLARRAGTWSVSTAAPPALKGPHRYGPFKDAFRNRMILVYGTRGSPEENAWALAKARFDAETFWYRGNGSPDVVSDEEFDTSKQPDRNVILYGHSSMNAAWERLIPRDGPVGVEVGVVRIGERKLRGADLACLFVQPRPDSDVAYVAVIAGTGLAGMRLTDRFPVFVSGVAYPDLTVISTQMLRTGAAGVRAAGFFGNDWSVEHGEFAFSEPAQE